MPYASTAQRGYVHAQAEKGVAWAKKFAKDADKGKQPTQKHVKKSVRRKRRVKRAY